MEIKTREAQGLQAGDKAGSNRLKALEEAFKSNEITQKGENIARKGKNTMSEAASQDCDAADAGAYATDKVLDTAKETAVKSAAKTKKEVKKSINTVRKEIRERRKERNAQSEGGTADRCRSAREYNAGNSRSAGSQQSAGNEGGYGRSGQTQGTTAAHRSDYRFSADSMQPSGTEGVNSGVRYQGNVSGTGSKAPSGKTSPGAEPKPEPTIKMKDTSIRIAEQRIRTMSEHTRKAAQKAKKAAKETRKAAQKAAKEAAKTTEKAAKATARTTKEVGETVVKAVSTVMEKFIAACASGGPIVAIVIAAAVYIGAIMYRVYDIADNLLSIFSLGGLIVWEGDVENLEEMINDFEFEPNPAIVALNESYHDRLYVIIENNRHDELVLENPDPDWGDILSFWAAWQLCENDGEFPDFAKSEMRGLSKVFNDMVTVEYEVTEDGEGEGSFGTSDGDSAGGPDVGGDSAHGADQGEKDEENPEPDEGGTDDAERLVLTISVEQLTIGEMAELYELGEDGDDYIELMTEGSLFEVIDILTKHLEGFEIPEEADEESETEGRFEGGGSF